jgi:bifunctional non-homologous end joining protein LigD
MLHMKMSFPEWVEPMAATLTQQRFTGPEWIFERKFDGIRLLAFRNGAEVQLLSRNRLPKSCPPIAEAIANLPLRDVILDGEVTWRTAGMVYHVFDLLWLDGRDVTSLPLDERRVLLDTLVLRSPLERVTALTDPKPWEQACTEGWEGVIAKRRDSPYEHRRSPHWLKMKCEASQELVVGGFTDPQGGRVGLGALLVGYFENEDFIFAGKVGTGFDTKLLLELRARLDALELPTSPFTKAVGLPRVRAHWVRPEIVVQVAFIEWTVHGKLRHSRFLGVRTDKSAREVVREMS